VLEAHGGGLTPKGMSTTINHTFWFAPTLVRLPIAHETRQIVAGRFLGMTELLELVSFKQAVV